MNETFKDSSFLINESRNWINDGKFKVVLSPQSAQVIYSGLKKIELFLSEILQQIEDLGDEHPDVREDLIRRHFDDRLL